MAIVHLWMERLLYVLKMHGHWASTYIHFADLDYSMGTFLKRHPTVCDKHTIVSQILEL